jgi:hypothetical protein
MQLKRPILTLSLMAALVALSGCGLTSDRPAEVDLLSALPSADKRAAAPVADAVRADVFAAAGDGRMSLVMEAPARVIWRVRWPLHARLRSAVAGSGRLRVGASNGRSYQEIGQVDASEGWAPIDLDLRALSEVKWSVFYQPLRMDWQLIFNADATVPGAVIAVDRPTLTRS